MTKVLLTGAAGGLGSPTYRQLLEDGYDVRATDQSRRPGAPGKIRVANLLDRESCYELVDDIEVVVHLANHSHAGAGNAQKVFVENVAMNMNVFQAAMESGVREIIYASSIQAMCGKRDSSNDLPPAVPYVPLDSDMPQNPGNPYALSKCVGEMQLQYFVKQQKLESATAVRFPLLLQRQWIAEWKTREANPQRRGGRGGRASFLDEAFSWLSFEDAARLLSAIVKADLPGYRSYLPAHPSPRNGLTPREVIEQYFPNIPLKKPIEQIDAAVDIGRITQDTGWTPVDGFATA